MISMLFPMIVKSKINMITLSLITIYIYYRVYYYSTVIHNVNSNTHFE